MLGQPRGAVEKQVAEVFQGRQLRQLTALHFVCTVLGDRGEARVDVLHHTVAIEQDEGAGALLDRALEQVKGAGGVAPFLVAQHVGVLVSQFAGEGDFVGLPDTRPASVFQAEHGDQLTADTDAGIQNGGNRFGSQVVVAKLTGARVVLGVVRAQ